MQFRSIQLDYRAQQHMRVAVLFSDGLYNKQWLSVFTINELQFPECLYPQTWKGLEWHLLNPGAQIFAKAQSSKLSSRFQHINKCSITALKADYSRKRDFPKTRLSVEIPSVTTAKSVLQTWLARKPSLSPW